MSNKTIQEKTPYQVLSKRISLTYKFWVFIVCCFLFLLVLFLVLAITGVLSASGGTIKLSDKGPIPITFLSIMGFAFWTVFGAKVIYQILMFLSLKKLVDTEQNQELNSLLHYMKKKLFVILIIYLTGPFTFYLLGFLPIVDFVLHLKFFTKAQEFQGIVGK